MSDNRPRLEGCDPTEFANLYPVWKQAREEAPVFWDDQLGYWHITRHADVAAAVLNTKQLSSEGFFALAAKVHAENQHLLPRGFEWEAPALANADPPTHTRQRRLCNEPFKPRRVAQLEPDLRRIADDLIDSFVADGACDLIEQFTVPLSLLAIARILGMPPSDIHEMRRYSDEMPESLNPNLTQQQQAEVLSHYGTFYDFIEHAINRAREHPGDDMLSTLVAGTEPQGGAAPALSEAELVALVGVLIVAGNDTTRYLIGNMLLSLFRHPDQLAAVREDPTLATSAVEETLRYFSSVKGNIRLAKSDVTFGDVTVPAGELVQVCWASTGRDRAVFERPDEFDIFRNDARKHIAFSRGPHACLGAGLARLEAKVALQQLLDRLPGLRLVREPDYPTEYASTVQIQGPSRLEIAWDEAHEPAGVEQRNSGAVR